LTFGVREAAIVAAVSAVSLLSASLLVQETRWDVSFDGIGGEDSLLDPGSSRLFTSSDVLVQYDVSPGKVGFLGGVYFEDREWSEDGGSMAVAGGWLFFGRMDFRLFAFPADSLPIDGGLHHFTSTDYRGPMNLLTSFDFVHLGNNKRLGELAFSNTTLFVAASEWGLGTAGHILALDMNDPSAMTTEPSSIQVLYNLTFEGTIADIAVQGAILYVLERTESSGTIHAFDISRVPPEESLSLRTAAIWRFDVEGDLLVTMGDRTVDVSRLGGTGATKLSSFEVPGPSGRIRLRDSKAYVTWSSTDRERNVVLFDLAAPDVPRLLWTIEVPDALAASGSDLVVMGDTLFLPGRRDIAVYHLATYPALITNRYLQSAFAISVTVALFTFELHRRLSPLRSDAHSSPEQPPRS